MSELEDSANMRETNYEVTISKLRDKLSKQTSDNEDLQAHCQDMRAKFHKSTRDSTTELADVQRSTTQPNQIPDRDIFILDQHTTDGAEDEVDGEFIDSRHDTRWA